VENAGQIIRRRGGLIVEAEGEESHRERALKKKMLINDERSRNVYENKQKDDNLPSKKDDISTQLHDILYRNKRILQESSAFLSLLERWGTNPSLQNVET
jgi:hypothetical protein